MLKYHLFLVLFIIFGVVAFSFGIVEKVFHLIFLFFKKISDYFYAKFVDLAT